MDPSRSNQDPQSNLGVNKLSRQIRKSPPQPALRPATTRPSAPQPQVYNIDKNDFRDIVQQLTGSPARDLPARSSPPQPQQRPQSQRLQKIRPPPLNPVHPLYQNPNLNSNPGLNPNFNPNHGINASFNPNPGLNPNFNPNPGLNQNQNPNPNVNQGIFPSPVSAYMQYLENSLLDTSRLPPVHQPGLFPSPVDPQTRPPVPAPQIQALPPFPYPKIPLSPNLQSPSAFLNLLSPTAFNGAQSQGGFVPGPGAGPPGGAPISPNFFFPNSPSGLLSPTNFFSILSPRWRND